MENPSPQRIEGASSPSTDMTARLPDDGGSGLPEMAALNLDLRTGARPVPEYELLVKLGEGGFGQVWKARDTDGFEIALKFLRLDERTGAAEMRALDVMKNIRHPHLLSVFRCWKIGNHLIIAMELADRTLYQRLDEAERQGFPGIPRNELLEYLREAAKGLDYLHSLGIQHRDVKPQNFLLVGGSVKVADFGLAKALGSGIASNSGAMTPAYAAPEFFRGTTDMHSDQYSLAITYCQLRGGKLPFEGTSSQVLFGHLNGTPDLSMVGPGERDALTKALAKKPEDRYPGCKAFMEALSAASVEMFDTTPIFQRPPTQAEAPPTRAPGATPPPSAAPASLQPAPARSWTPMLVGVGVLALLAAAAIGWSLNLFPGLLPTTVAQQGNSHPDEKPDTTEDIKTPDAKVEPKKVESPKKVEPPPVAGLRLEPLEPVRIQAGQTTALTVKVKRENLAAAIALVLEGLPAGVTASTVSIPANQDSVRVELAAESKASPVSKEIALTARSGDLRAQGIFRLEIVAAPLAKVVVNAIGMKLALIPAGKFLMGSPEQDEDRRKDEEPRHEVEIQRPFYLGQHEVTRGQFSAFVEATGYRTEAERTGGGVGFNEKSGEFEGPRTIYSWKNTGFSKTDEHPVVNVTWNDAVAFCEWLSKKETRKYALPTEAEWEYACRAGTTTAYPGAGPDAMVEVANVADAAARRTFPRLDTTTARDGFVFTAPVGSFKPNAWGLFDMHGNAWEWCRDWYAASYPEEAAKDPQGPETGTRRVIRGGSWSNVPARCRAANRGKFLPDYRHPTLGFRVALYPE